MDIKGIIADQMGHFSVHDIPEVIFVVLFATVLSYVMARFGAGGTDSDSRRMALWGGLGALVAAIVRSQLPVAMLFVGAAILVGRQERVDGDRVVTLSAVAIGIGCGTGASLIIALVLIPYLFILRWAIPRAAR